MAEIDRKGKRLTDAECRNIKAGTVLYDGGGLRLIAGDGARARVRWSLRFTSPVTGARRDAGLGPYPDVTIRAARQRADELREIVRAGRDPIDDRDRASAQARTDREAAAAAERRNAATIAALTRDYHKRIKGGFRNAKHAAQWLSSLETHAFPKIGDKPIAAVTPDDLLGFLLPLNDAIPETAKRVRERLAAVFDDAAMRGLCDRNPAAIVRRALRRKAGPERHFRSLPYARVPAFVAALGAFDGADPIVKLALEFVILTAARSGEVRGATWREIIDSKAWIVPGERMKAGQEHRVPLSTRARAILRDVRPYSDGKPGSLIFPGRDPAKPLSDMTLTALLRRMETGRQRDDGEPETFADLATVHGFRSAFSTWAREKTAFRPDVIEAALAHREQDRVAAAYNRAAYLRDRAALADAWAAYIGSGGVVAIAGRSRKRSA